MIRVLTSGQINLNMMVVSYLRYLLRSGLGVEAVIASLRLVPEVQKEPLLRVLGNPKRRIRAFG